MNEETKDSTTSEDIKYPEWVVKVDGRHFACDPDACYRAYLAELGQHFDGVDANVYWVEVARRCATQDLKAITGPGIMIKWENPHVLDDDGNRTGDKVNKHWAFHRLPAREGMQRSDDERDGIAQGALIHKKLIVARAKKSTGQ